MKLVAVTRPTETREIVVDEGGDYEAAKAAVEAQLPEGWEIISLRRTKD